MTEDLRMMAKAESLKDITRLANEALSDLNKAIKEAREVMAEIETAAAKEVGERMGEAIRIGLEQYVETIKTATDSATAAVYERFDRIAAMLLGETKTAQRTGPSLQELVEAIKEGRNPNG